MSERIVHYSKDGVALEPDEGFAWMKVTDHVEALRQAVEPDPRTVGVPSTKGVL